jgi:cytosine/adenosine deaminase-related metal-dependent hydrolase
MLSGFNKKCHKTHPSSSIKERDRPMKTKVTGAYVIGYDGADHVIYPDGEVVYEGDTILFVGHGYAEPVDQTIDGGLALVSPGFIDLDALADIDHAILDTWNPPDLDLSLQWSEQYFHEQRHDVFTLAEELFKRHYALVQLILNGITTAMPIAAETYKGWCESYEEFAGVAEIAGALGLRMYLGPSYRSGINVVRADGSRDVLWETALGEQGLDDAIRFVRDFDGAYDGLIRGALLPCRIETVTPDLLRRTKAAADELGCHIRLHALQGLTELRLVRAWYDKTPLELISDLGLLGPNFLIPHGIYIGGHPETGLPDRGELELLAATGTSIIHCPLTSIRYAHALDSFDRYRRAGVNIALGTDSFPPDLIRGMDYGNNITKLLTGDKSAGAAAAYFRAATLGGAQALGRDDLGRLAPGAKADLIIVDFSKLRTGPIDDPIRTLLMHAGGADVQTVIINGRTVMRDGVIPGVDLDRFKAQGQAYFAKLKGAYPARDYQQRPVEQLFPSSFRIVPTAHE